jgi:hypothetical protein
LNAECRWVSEIEMMTCQMKHVRVLGVEKAGCRGLELGGLFKTIQVA